MSDRLEIVATTGGVRIPIRVIPRSPRTRIDGVRGGRLLVRVTAPPVDAAANDAVIALLAATFKTSRGAIAIVGGATSRNKTIEVAGIGEPALRALLLHF
jgi:uncharacterized protein (TIGR00251 family)